jgi:hypothetical protein
MSLDPTARRAAKHIGLVAKKSRPRRYSIDNLDGFRLIDPFQNRIVAGERFAMTADEVIDFCREQ